MRLAGARPQATRTAKNNLATRQARRTRSATSPGLRSADSSPLAILPTWGERDSLWEGLELGDHNTSC